MNKYQVIVGNIGTIYDGNFYGDAMAIYAHYVEASKYDMGRAAGENVTLMNEGEISVEYIGDINND